ncbi:MAG: uroporphyrinogen decarboxylase family protein [Chloroflexota bacterium]|jgi:uroporphyrinogen decarboxylase
MANRDEMTSYQRLSAALRLEIPDRVPVVLVSSTHGARELGLSLPEYFSRPENVAEGQLRFTERIGHDNVDAYYYAVREAEAFGAEPMFREDGPPGMGAPVIRDPAAIDSLQAPDPLQSPPLQAVLRSTELIANEARGRWLIIGHVLGPTSLPILLMGEDAWLDLLLFGNVARRKRLVQITRQFCVSWANALLSAGADAIAIAEPMATSTILTREQAKQYVLPEVRRVVKSIRGPSVLWGVGSTRSIADLVPDLGVRALSTDPSDDLREVKTAVARRIALLGGLNDLAMLSWSPHDAEAAARRAIEEAAPGGGFILSHQNEIPTSVGHDILAAVVDAARRWGRYVVDGKGQIVDSG